MWLTNQVSIWFDLCTDNLCINLFVCQDSIQHLYVFIWINSAPKLRTSRKFWKKIHPPSLLRWGIVSFNWIPFGSLFFGNLWIPTSYMACHLSRCKKQGHLRRSPKMGGVSQNYDYLWLNWTRDPFQEENKWFLQQIFCPTSLPSNCESKVRENHARSFVVQHLSKGYLATTKNNHHLQGFIYPRWCRISSIRRSN